MGRIEDGTEFTDDLPGRLTRGGGWSTGGREGRRPEMGRGIVHSDQGGYARHLDYHVHLHMQRVANELWRLRRRQDFDRLVIGGQPEAIAALRQALPRSLERLLAGEFAAELFASDADVIERARGIEENAERAQEKELIQEIVQRSLKGERAVTGWDETLIALCEGRVHRLALIEGVSTAGYACPDAHMAVTEHVERCPFCEEPTWRVDDLASWAAQRAAATDAGVEFVRGEAAELLRPHGAAALLRYQ
jgi:peptide subunit release factor 1 (eRF1)